MRENHHKGGDISTHDFFQELTKTLSLVSEIGDTVGYAIKDLCALRLPNDFTENITKLIETVIRKWKRLMMKYDRR